MQRKGNVVFHLNQNFVDLQNIINVKLENVSIIDFNFLIEIKLKMNNVIGKVITCKIQK